jgi:hypothetical protein
VAELTPIPSPSAQRPADPGYQPVSGYAVAAALVAGVFAVIAAVLLVQAVFSGRTALWDELLAVPVLGIILAAIARSHIRNSEGTRTGLRLATTAWWVCVLGGVAYAAYLQANSFALKRESGRYADRFFDKLKAGRVHQAFEDLLPPEERGRADANNPEAFEAAYGPAGFLAFKNHELVRLVVRNGSAVELEHVGVKDFGQESAGFQATHLYRLTCPEGEFDVQVKLTAAESRKSRQPQWYIPSQPVPNISVRPVRISQYGRLLAELAQEADGYVKVWMGHLAGGRLAWAHLMTLPGPDRRPPETALEPAAALIGGPVAAVPLRRESLPPDRAKAVPVQSPTSLAAQARLAFDDLAAAGFFRFDLAGTALHPDRLTKLRELWVPPRLTPQGAGRQSQMSPTSTESPVITVTPDGLLFVAAADLIPDSPAQFIRSHVAATCTEPGVLAALADARAKGAAADDMSVTLQSLPPRDWRIAWLQTDMEAQAVSQGPPGMGGPPGR